MLSFLYTLHIIDIAYTNLLITNQRKIDLIEELKKLAGLSILKNLYNEEEHKYLLEACQKEGLTYEPSPRTCRLLDKVYVYVHCISIVMLNIL